MNHTIVTGVRCWCPACGTERPTVIHTDNERFAEAASLWCEPTGPGDHRHKLAVMNRHEVTLVNTDKRRILEELLHRAATATSHDEPAIALKRGPVHSIKIAMTDPDLARYRSAISLGEPLYVATERWVGQAYVIDLKLMRKIGIDYWAEVTLKPTGAPHA